MSSCKASASRECLKNFRPHLKQVVSELAKADYTKRAMKSVLTSMLNSVCDEVGSVQDCEESLKVERFIRTSLYCKLMGHPLGPYIISDMVGRMLDKCVVTECGCIVLQDNPTQRVQVNMRLDHMRILKEDGIDFGKSKRFTGTHVILLYHGFVPGDRDNASHLCHNHACINIDHLVFEHELLNFARRKCAQSGECCCGSGCIMFN